MDLPGNGWSAVRSPGLAPQLLERTTRDVDGHHLAGNAMELYAHEPADLAIPESGVMRAEKTSIAFGTR